jgi:nickel transport protein
VLAIVTWLTLTGAAQAHRLVVECHVLRDGKVQVEGWFDLTGNAAKGALVQVFQAGEQPRVEGKLDAQGIFVFSLDQVRSAAKADGLRVVVSAGEGHRAEEVIPADQLNFAGATTHESANRASPGNLPLSPPSDNPSEPRSLSDRGSRVSFKDVLLGVTFLLAVAAFAQSIRNARKLRKLRELENTGRKV